MADRFGYAIWPGIDSMLSVHYALGHGITPGVADLKSLPQTLTTTYLPTGTTGFKEIGDLVITDGAETVTLPDCRVVEIHSDNSNGTDWHFKIEDRRWRWRDCGTISGAYNQLDDHGKLIPWTIRSPMELVKLCLDAMGEFRVNQLLGQNFFNTSVDMPPGLDSKVGALAEKLNPPWIGVKPTTGTNPPINWVNEKPMYALQQICDLFGRRLIYRWSTNGVMIARPGVGKDLPDDGSIFNFTPAISKPVKPSAVAVFGSPTRYQAKLVLEAVGKEWDGSYRPIEFLSYRPQPTVVGGVAQVTQCSVLLPQTGVNFKLTVNGVEFEVSSVGTDAAATVAALVAAVNASTNPLVQGKVTAGGSAALVVGQSFLLTAAIKGVPFDVSTAISGTGGTNAAFENFIVTAPQVGTTTPGGWQYSVPGQFHNVAATSRLTYYEARDLAKESVWKTYRLANYSPQGTRIFIPGFGEVRRRQQIVLQDTKVEQVRPEAQDENLLDRTTNQPLTLNFYNGYSRDVPAAVYGSHTQNGLRGLTGWWTGYSGNQDTPPGSQVMVPFSLDPVQQLVKFSDYVFRSHPGLSQRRQQTRVSLGPVFPVEGGEFQLTVNGVVFKRTVAADETSATITANLVSQINASVNPLIQGILTAGSASTFDFVITGSQSGVAFAVTTATTGTGLQFSATTTQGTSVRGGSNRITEPFLVLETGMNIRNAATNNLEQFYLSRAVPGGDPTTPAMVEKHDDVQLNVIAQYENIISLVPRGFTILEADAINRANYYLDGMTMQFYSKGAVTVEYNGIRALDVDGSIQQITWIIDEGGAVTTASKNMEHSVYVAPYPQRRRAEFLNPVQRRAIADGANPQRSFLNPINPQSGI